MFALHCVFRPSALIHDGCVFGFHVVRKLLSVRACMVVFFFAVVARGLAARIFH